MIPNRNTVLYTKQGQISELMDLVHRGTIKHSDAVYKEYRAGDMFSVREELFPEQDEKILLFEGMTIESIRIERDLIVLQFDGEEWYKRTRDVKFKRSVRDRKTRAYIKYARAKEQSIR